MADLKISQLTAATTPLGATDVLPVVQSGTTKKVAASAIAQVGQDNSFTASQTITKTGASDTQVVLVSTLDGSNDYQSALSVRRTGTAGGALWQSKRNTATGGVGWIAKVTANNAAEVAGTFSDAVEITNDGNLKISTGNLVIGTSGKGIDFSATPGTGTSELLADYEEGTWTPAFGAFAGAFTSLTYSVQSGKYTKVGNQVTAEFFIVVTAVTTGTAATILLVTGLPFTPVSGVCVTTYQGNFLTQGPDFGQFYGAGSNMLLRFKSLNSSVNVDPTQVTNATELQGLVTYFV
jgi:hypothetical protein